MSKGLTTILFISVFLCGILLAFQWNEYRTIYPTNASSKGFVSKSKVIHKENHLNVEQAFFDLENKLVSLKVPYGAHKIVCEDHDGNPCKIENKKGILTLKLNGNYFKLTYVLSFQGSAIYKPIQNPFFTFQEKDRQGDFELTIVEKANVKAEWIFSGNKRGVSVKDTLKLSTFNDNQLEGSLYYTTNPLKALVSENNLKIYGETISPSHTDEIKRLLNTLSFEDKLLIIVDQRIKKPIYNKNMVVISSLGDFKALKFNLVFNLLNHHWKFSSKGALEMKQFLTYVILGEHTTNEQLKPLLEHFYNLYDKKSQKIWIDKVLKYPSEPIQPANFDQINFGIMGVKSDYYTLNIAQEEQIPYFEVIDKVIEINHLETKFEAVKYKNNLYLPVKALNNFGFVIKKQDRSEVTIQYQRNEWIFSKNKRVFKFNGDYFEISQNPVHLLGKELYMSELWLSELFKVDVLESRNKISLNL